MDRHGTLTAADRQHTLEADPAVKVIVFASADEDYSIAHFDVRCGADLPHSDD